MESSQPTSSYQQPMFYNNIPSQSGSMSLMKICQFNCPCCNDMQNGKGQCGCSRVKCTVATQTDGLDYIRTNDLNTSFWQRGTIPHNLLQDCIRKKITKYQLSKKSDLLFDKAVTEVMSTFPDMEFTAKNQDKVSQRIHRAIRWGRFLTNKKSKGTQDKNPAEVPRSEAEDSDNENTTV